MQKYSQDIVAEVLAATDIVEVVGASLELKPAGGNRLKALCPFHPEKTPSFIVSRDRQTFHCFGCDNGGDAITFVMEQEGLSFVEALRKLADRAGVRLPALKGESNEREFLRLKLLDFGRFAASFYIRTLRDPRKGKPGRDYIEQRQLNQQIVERFGIGYVPEGWQQLLDAARQKGFSNQVLKEAGLFKQGNQGLYDFFRNRLIFPIKDVSGNVVAFGGRDMGDSPAKYINSPETQVYKKSRVLYGLHDARDALRKEKYAILVEGYFDCLRCFNEGIENVVATCGTALTEQQATLLRRYAQEVVVVYDGDDAGIKAALKASGILTAAGLTVRALALPGGQDPDDYVREAGREAFLEQVRQAPDFVSFFARMNQDKAKTIEGRTAVAQEIFGMLRSIEDTLRIDEYIRLLSKALGLDEWACRREFERSRRSNRRRAYTPEQNNETSASAAFTRDDCDFVASLLQDASLLAKAKERLSEVQLEPGPLTTVLIRMFTYGTELPVQELEEDAARQLYTAAGNTELNRNVDIQVLVDKRVTSLERAALMKYAKELEEKLRTAERAKDHTLINTLFLERMKLLQKLERVGAA